MVGVAPLYITGSVSTGARAFFQASLHDLPCNLLSLLSVFLPSLCSFTFSFNPPLFILCADTDACISALPVPLTTSQRMGRFCLLSLLVATVSAATVAASASPEYDGKLRFDSSANATVAYMVRMSANRAGEKRERGEDKQEET